jgi:hypothetical protein
MISKITTSRISIFANAKTERVYKASTSLSISEFNELAQAFAAFYKPVSAEEVIQPYGIPNSIQDDTELLFLVLYHLKTAVTYDVLGLSFGMSNRVAFNYVIGKLGKQILKRILEQKKSIPKRLFETKEAFESYFKDVDTIRIDATEYPTQRPVNEQDQRDRYTLKKLHALRCTVITTPVKRIDYLGDTVAGGKHQDHGLLKKKFPCSIDYFKHKTVSIDLGYLGLNKD